MGKGVIRLEIGTDGSYDQVNVDDVIFLARSLGFACYEHEKKPLSNI